MGQRSGGLPAAPVSRRGSWPPSTRRLCGACAHRPVVRATRHARRRRQLAVHHDGGPDPRPGLVRAHRLWPRRWPLASGAAYWAGAVMSPGGGRRRQLAGRGRGLAARARRRGLVRAVDALPLGLRGGRRSRPGGPGIPRAVCRLVQEHRAPRARAPAARHRPEHAHRPRPGRAAATRPGVVGQVPARCQRCWSMRSAIPATRPRRPIRPYGGLLVGIEAVAIEMRARGLDVHVEVVGGVTAGTGSPAGPERRWNRACAGVRSAVPAPVAAAMAHAVREALANVASHAGTGEAWVEVSLPVPGDQAAAAGWPRGDRAGRGRGFRPRRASIRPGWACGDPSSSASPTGADRHRSGRQPGEGTVVSLRLARAGAARRGHPARQRLPDPGRPATVSREAAAREAYSEAELPRMVGAVAFDLAAHPADPGAGHTCT